jgi:tRNA dimethylallyltransferase
LNSKRSHNCIVVLGATASGKTRLACRIAYELNGEIISADSRQVYKQLDIGTGKDLEEYKINEKQVPYHLIDICEPQQQFYLHDFMRECCDAFHSITSREKLPVICGGTGLYLDSLHKDFSYTQIPDDKVFRNEAEKKTREELAEMLNRFPEEYRKNAAIDSKKRTIRAIEIARSLSVSPNKTTEKKNIYNPFYIGIHVTKEERMDLISFRLEQRLKNGLIEEVESLLNKGISHERLQFLGLEYRFLSLFLKNELSFDEMKTKLQTAIIQFSKRQMTWFRKMEKEGIEIHWIRRDEDPTPLISALNNLFSTAR